MATADAEPSGEPPAEAGAAAVLRAAAEASLLPVRGLVADQALLPQHALGVLSFVADVLNCILVNLSEPEALSKFSRVKLSALRKKIAPKHVEAILKAAGFAIPSDSPEHLEWNLQTSGSLAGALATKALITQVQELAQSKGLRALTSPLDPSCASLRAVLCASFGGIRLLEPCNPVVSSPKQANAVEGWLVRRTWLRERLPQLAAALEELPSLFEPRTLFSFRERTAKDAVHRAINEARAAHGAGDAARLAHSPVLAELAQLAAAAELVRLRKPEMFRPPPAAAPEPDVEPSEDEGAAALAEELPSVGAKELIMPALLECVPAFRLGLPHGAVSEILRLSEVPAFFTMEQREKAFQVSVDAFSERVVASWCAKPALAQQLLRTEASAIGIGCALDIGHDDKAVIFVVIG